MAIFVTCAAGAVGVPAAQAGIGHLDTDRGSCDFTFEVSPSFEGHPGWDSGLEIHSAVAYGYCDAVDMDAQLHLHWTYAGDAQALGIFYVPGLFSGWCAYSGTLNGTWDGTTFDLDDPSSQELSRVMGSFINCPSSTMTVLSDTVVSGEHTWLTP
ncbi:MAG: hypothetical protein J0H98_05525 [Solirubrobacterales bacterium]|nr:hypothetical protein [Solirubrobacterales bacterium]